MTVKDHKALIFDLDDTLVDTFNCLIRPLESRAAAEMVAAGMGESDPRRVTAVLLQLRRHSPSNLEEGILRAFPLAAGKALMARRTVFANATVDGLVMERAVRDLMRRLPKDYERYLLTAGPEEFQRRKVDLLGIRDLFSDIVVLPSGSKNSEETKERWLSSLMSGDYRKEVKYDPESVIVLGNRLDNEIQAGNRLGMITVWLRYGEGSGLVPNEVTGQPDYTISAMSEFPNILRQIESSCASQPSNNPSL